MDNQTSLLFISFVFAAVGALLFFFPPKKINKWYGYRTFTSTSKQEYWDYCQKKSGQLLLTSGLILLFASGLIWVFKINLESQNGKILNGVLIFGSIIYVIIFTERGLKKQFNLTGKK